MKFNEWTTAYSVFKKLAGKKFCPDWRTFYSNAIDLATREGRIVAANQFKGEFNWLQADRCYYNVWPKIIPMLIRLNLKKIDSSWMKLPMPELCIRLPERDNPLVFVHQDQQFDVRCMLMSDVRVGDTRGVCIWLDVGEKEQEMPVYNFYSFRFLENRTLHDEIINLPRREGADVGVQVPFETLVNCIRLCCTLCFLGNDPHLITPDVLVEDLNKFEDTGDIKYVEKAKKRHKVGWNIGSHIDVSPHWRRPHLALYWVGQGRSTPVILPRKGALIHKEAIAKIPTGYLGEI